ncbi:MAG: VCBS repeat-containing protein [Candidatus Latescibacterota bacterium]|nr:VCBS repeat-containing protein [Candidatus Latescibacterota bacterium]
MGRHALALIVGSVLTAPATWAQLSDVSSASGADNAGLYSPGFAWGDYDADGDLDLYVTNWATAVSVPSNKLLNNGGDSTFSDVAPALDVDNDQNSIGATWADYDNDGDLDLYVVDFFDQDYLYQSQSNGTSFSEVGRRQKLVDLTKAGSSTSAAFGDVDNDGWLDLYIGKFYHDNELYVSRGDGRGLVTFDRVDDLGVGDRRDTAGFDWVDMDNDGDLDLYVVNRDQENALYRNDLADGGPFTEVACALSVASTEIGQAGAWADYDNDGDLDVFVANVGANALYRNDGGTTFVNVAAAAGVRQSGSGWITAAAAWADYNGDGFSDLYLASGGDEQFQPDLLFVGGETGVFADSTASAGLPTSVTAQLSTGWADFDGTGTPDLYATNGFGPYGPGNRLFRNDRSPDTFLRVLVRGVGPSAGGANLAAIGAQVRLIDAASNDTVAYQQVLPKTALIRTVESDGVTAAAAEIIFGAPAGPYNVHVRFPGNDVPITRGVFVGGEVVIIDEEAFGG